MMQVREAKHYHRLFDYLMYEYNLKTNASLADALCIDPPVLSRIRSGKTQVTPALMLSIYDFSGLSIEEIRALLKD